MSIFGGFTKDMHHQLINDETREEVGEVIEFLDSKGLLGLSIDLLQSIHNDIERYSGISISNRSSENFKACIDELNDGCVKRSSYAIDHAFSIKQKWEK